VFALKLAVVLHLKDHILLQPDAGLDTSVYLDLARRVTAGDLTLGPGLYFVSPLYIYFAALVLAAADSVTAIRVAQVTLGTVSVALVWWMARTWRGPAAAWIAAALAALTGLFTFYETLLLQAALDPFLTACALAALTAALTRASAWWFAAAGLALGVQALNRPNVLLAAAGLVVALAVARRLRGAGLVAAGVVLALAPVTIRNVVVSGDWTPVSSHGGLNFHIGNNPGADGTYAGAPGITPSIAGQQDDARRVAEAAVGRRLADADVSAYFYGLGFGWIREHPAAAAGLFARKLAYTFNAAHLPLNYSYPFYARDVGGVLRVLVVGPWLLIPLGLAGLAWHAWTSRSTPFVLWASFVPLYALSVALFFASERYRLPLLVPLAVGSGLALDAVVEAVRRREVRAAAALAAGTLLLAAATNWPLGFDDGRAEERTRMAERLIRAREFDRAEDWLRRAEAVHTRPGVLHFRAGRALVAAGRADAAIAHLRRSAEIDPGQREVDFALGQALLEGGRPAEAVPHLRRAYEAGVRSDLSGYDLARALARSGDRSGAIAVLQNVTPARGDDADSWFALGQLAFELKAAGLAEAFYTRAVRARPTFAVARQQLGLVYAVGGRFAEAAQQLEQSVALNPSDPAAHLNLAVAYAELRRRDEAIAQARRALELNPSYERAQQLLRVLSSRQ
jgi:tetratricopeptide (TPR) repeat protein